MGDVHAAGNPHYMMDPERAKLVARAIAGRFAKLDAANAAMYADNLAKLLARIEAAEAEAKTLLDPYRGAKVVTYHKSLSYLAERYGLNVLNTVEPKPGIPPSGAHVTTLLDQMKAEGVKAILLEPWYDRSVPELLAQKTGARVVIVPILVGGEPDSQDYPSLVTLVARRVAEALGGKS
jgi:zinc/manganese transport system substrate-binding protein